MFGRATIRLGIGPHSSLTSFGGDRTMCCIVLLVCSDEISSRLNDLQESLEIIGSIKKRQIIYDFLLLFHNK